MPRGTPPAACHNNAGHSADGAQILHPDAARIAHAANPRPTPHGSASVVIGDVLPMAARMIEGRGIAMMIPRGAFGDGN